MITENGYVIAVGNNDAEYNTIMQKIQNKPTDPDGYAYKLRADNLEWELVKLPPIEPEPTIEDKAEAYDVLMGDKT